MGTGGAFPRGAGEGGWGVKLTTHPRLVPSLMRGAIPPLSLRLHSLVFSLVQDTS